MSGNWLPNERPDGIRAIHEYYPAFPTDLVDGPCRCRLSTEMLGVAERQLKDRPLALSEMTALGCVYARRIENVLLPMISFTSLEGKACAFNEDSGDQLQPARSFRAAANGSGRGQSRPP